MKKSLLTYRQKPGFSLVETVIVVGLVAGLMLAIIELFINFNTSYDLQNANINNSYSAAAFLNETEELSLQADSVVASRTINSTTYTSGTSTLVLELPSIDSSGDIISNAHDYAVMYVASSSVYRVLQADAASVRHSGTKLFSDVVNSLTFTYNNVSPASTTKIAIDIITQKQIKQKTLQTHLTQTVYLRNL